MDPVDPNIE
nr:Chain Y, HIV-1 TAT PROTEIN DERIVED N-TERMINAL NONAPEPTIDE [Human immunodeficiency virus 1]2BGR_Z Chain Z, HIV-1 TAT PROTEIN DERIVED N-TERMINAL NONAPEPTIDE [Human immunodeficiency virus 1]